MLAKSRIALVLGAGGPVGHAFHSGVLAGFHELGWDARGADIVIGTSAGAQVGALLRADIAPAQLVDRVLGRSAPEALTRHFVRPDYNQPVYQRRMVPASPRYLLRDLVRPWRWHPGRFLGALLPEGRICLQPQIAGFRQLFGTGWPERHLWLPALSLRTGDRVAFGHPSAPKTCVGTAVACSGAVPGVCKPLTVCDEAFVDGGVLCPTHVDLLADQDIDTLVVSSPLSMFRPLSWLLRWQLRRFRRRGVRVISVEPTAALRRQMGWNPMDLALAPRVAELAKQMAIESARRPNA